MFWLRIALLGCLGWTLFSNDASASQTWRTTGSMSTSLRHAVIERLPDGRILVAGTNTTGVDGSASSFFSTAEIYDPVAGTWTATGSMTTGRARADSSISLEGKSCRRRLERVGGVNFGGNL